MYRDAPNHVPTNIAFGNFSDIKRHRPWLRTFFLKAEQPAYINLVGQNKVTSFLRLKEVSLSTVLWSLGVSCFFLFMLVPSWAAGCCLPEDPPILNFFSPKPLHHCCTWKDFLKGYTKGFSGLRICYGEYKKDPRACCATFTTDTVKAHQDRIRHFFNTLLQSSNFLGHWTS